MSTSNTGVLARYLELRDVQRGLNRLLVQTLSRKAIEESARRLGCYVGGTITADSEADLDLMQDVALYDYFPSNDKNAVDRYASRDADIGANERVVLGAMSRARFTLVELEQRVPEVGVEAHDLLFGERFLLADVGLSQTAPFGLVLATRVLRFDGFSMTSGAHRVFDAELTKLVVEPLASTMEVKGPVERWSSRDRSALARLLVQLTTVERDEARHMLAAHAVASLPSGDPRRVEYARLRARWEDRPT